MKKVMILGGGYYQLPLIKASRKLGYYTVVCGTEGNYPGYQYADKWYNENTFDKETCLKIAQNEKIDGVCVCGTDTVLPTVGYINDKMGLTGISHQTAVNVCNKAQMKELFVTESVRTADYKKASSVCECIDFAQKYNFNVVLKVVDSSGSRGIAIVNSEDELMLKYPEIVSKTRKDYIIVEQYLKGEEFGAQAFVKNGKITFVMPHGDIVFKGDAGVPVGHYVPYEQGEVNLKEITYQIKKCVIALGIDNAALNVDFILMNGLVYVLEIGARAGATCLPELVSEYYGINYYEYILKNCVGDTMDFVATAKTPCVVETLFSEKSGIVKSINLPNLPREVTVFELYPKEGDTVRQFKNAYDRIGHIVLTGNSVKELFVVLQDFKRKIKLNLE